MLKKASLCLFVLATVSACGGKNSHKPQESELTALTIENIEIGEGDAQWQTLVVATTGVEPKVETKESTFEKKQSQSTQSVDPNLLIKAGIYTFKLTYKDKDGKVVYESCKSEIEKKHDVKGATYEPDIDICPVGSDVPLDDDVKVTLKPKLVKEDEGEIDPALLDLKKLDGEWSVCFAADKDNKTSQERVWVIDQKSKKFTSKSLAHNVKDCKQEKPSVIKADVIETIESIEALSDKEFKISLKGEAGAWVRSGYMESDSTLVSTKSCSETKCYVGATLLRKKAVK